MSLPFYMELTNHQTDDINITARGNTNSGFQTLKT